MRKKEKVILKKNKSNKPIWFKNEVSHLASSSTNTSSDIWGRVEGVARDIFTGEFWRDTIRDGVSSLKGDSLLKVTKKENNSV